MSDLKQLSLEEVKKHNTASDCWTVIHNKVSRSADFNETKITQILFLFLGLRCNEILSRASRWWRNHAWKCRHGCHWRLWRCWVSQLLSILWFINNSVTHRMPVSYWRIILLVNWSSPSAPNSSLNTFILVTTRKAAQRHFSGSLVSTASVVAFLSRSFWLIMFRRCFDCSGCLFLRQPIHVNSTSSFRIVFTLFDR